MAKCRINGADPTGSFVSLNGKFYGITKRGGTNDKGVLFEFDPSIFALDVVVVTNTTRRTLSGYYMPIKKPIVSPVPNKVTIANKNTNILPKTAIFTKNLFPNTRNTEVKKLQQLLKDLGYFNYIPTGYYGPITKLAVRKYQKDHNIPQTGNVGPLTRKALRGIK